MTYQFKQCAAGCLDSDGQMQIAEREGPSGTSELERSMIIPLLANSRITLLGHQNNLLECNVLQRDFEWFLQQSLFQLLCCTTCVC